MKRVIIGEGSARVMALIEGALTKVERQRAAWARRARRYRETEAYRSWCARRLERSQ